jgi:ABC-2 type transport system ATP-binding protein
MSKLQSGLLPALHVEDLVVQRGPFQLNVHGLKLAAGRLTCIAGANGSGKTTLLETITGLLPKVAGTVYIAGRSLGPDALQAKRLIGYVPDDDAWIIPELTAQEFFTLVATVYKPTGVPAALERSRKLAADLMFTGAGQQLGSLSHGNRKKVQLISALMHDPALLIVDELRNGLDPIVILRAENLLRSLTSKGMAVLAATHDLWWAERFSDDLIMLDSGSIVLQAPTKTVVKDAGSVEAKFLSLYGARA